MEAIGDEQVLAAGLTAKVSADRLGGGRNSGRCTGSSRRRTSAGSRLAGCVAHVEMDVLLGEAPDALDLVQHRVDQRASRSGRC